MPKNRIILIIGFAVAVLPFLGFPSSWKFYLTVFFGLSIMALSILITIDKKIKIKLKAESRHLQRKKSIENEGNVIQNGDNIEGEEQAYDSNVEENKENKTDF